MCALTLCEERVWRRTKQSSASALGQFFPLGLMPIDFPFVFCMSYQSFLKRREIENHSAAWVIYGIFLALLLVLAWCVLCGFFFKTQKSFVADSVREVKIGPTDHTKPSQQTPFWCPLIYTTKAQAHRYILFPTKATKTTEGKRQNKYAMTD